MNFKLIQVTSEDNPYTFAANSVTSKVIDVKMTCDTGLFHRIMIMHLKFLLNTSFNYLLLSRFICYMCRFMAFLWLMSWFVITLNKWCDFDLTWQNSSSGGPAPLNFIWNYDKSAHQPQECHETLHMLLPDLLLLKRLLQLCDMTHK